MSGLILSCPLRHLEELGANRILATLTDDILSISTAVFDIPFLCINIALVVGCLAYLCWLSWAVFLVTLVFLVVAIGSVQILLTKASWLLKYAREEQDKLFKHFRAITDGIKELKLHIRRREAFLNEELQISAASSRDYRVNSLRILAIATNFGELLFFIILGLLVFGLPKLTTINAPVLSGYVLTITYLIRPLQSILEILPALSQASIALQKAKEYLKQLQLEHKVQVKGGVLSTTDLSQGQRKRLALLTAYLEDRPIYLFDEWASDQDPFFRGIFYKQLLPELKHRNKTVLVISHDDRYFHLADRMIKLDYGKVA
jgi:ABC-type siderophore export system fused ATPase/permease subunit